MLEFHNYLKDAKNKVKNKIKVVINEGEEGPLPRMPNTRGTDIPYAQTLWDDMDSAIHSCKNCLFNSNNFNYTRLFTHYILIMNK